MTALDKAFVKAYQQAGEAPTATPLEFARPVRLNDALVEDPKPSEEDFSDLADAVFSVLATTGRPRFAPRPDDGESDAETETADGDPTIPAFLKAARCASSPAAGLSTDSLGVPIQWHPPQLTEEPEASTKSKAGKLKPKSAPKPLFKPLSRLSLESSNVIAPKPTIEHDAHLDFQPPTEKPVNERHDDRQDPVVPPAVAGPRHEDSPFRPMLQVDNFAWPTICEARHPAGEAALDQFAAGLVGLQGSRRTVVAVAGASQGAGCTTLLLSAARRLARRRLDVVVVDANRATPDLAGRLGLLPEMGWEQVAAGRLPLAETLIESIDDRLTLLPLCRPNGVDPTAPSLASLDAGVATSVLREHYDLVLVDLGVPDPKTNPIGPETGKWLDGVVLVHDVRAGSLGQVMHARNRLTESGVRVIGIVENFASGEARRAA